MFGKIFVKNFELTKRENRVLLNKWHFSNLDVSEAISESLRLEKLFSMGDTIEKPYRIMGRLKMVKI